MMAHHSIPRFDPKSFPLLALALVLALPAGARAAACPGGTVPQIQILATLPEPSYRHNSTRSQLGAVANRRGHMTSDKSHKGLTHTETRLRIPPATFEMTPMGNGTVCVTLKRMEVSWRMEQFQVDVASEYRTDSCAYRETLRHENEHVAIFQRGFRTAEQRLRRDLADVAQRNLPFQTRKGQEKRGIDAVARKFAAAAQAVVAKYNQDMERENGAIDTQANYRAVAARCRDW